jgi:energy-coupling factor transporter ATP-binding protein EcfA2
MSFWNSEEKKNIPFALVKGGQADGEIVYMRYEDENQKRSLVNQEPIKHYIVDDGKFFQIPNEKTRCVLVAGPSGSGKSTWVRNYASMYKTIYPDAKIWLFSRKDYDPSLDGLELTRIILSDDLVANPLEIEEVSRASPGGSMVIFDDCDCVTSNQLSKSIFAFQMQLLELGRQWNIQVVIAQHLIIGVKSQQQARVILNEMGSLVVFPGAGSANQISYALTKYYGLTKKQINLLMNMKTRSLSIIKMYPQFVIAEHELKFISELK